MRTKDRLIAQILALNSGATTTWLARFDAPALRRYLDHLEHALEPRGAASYWTRDGETSAAFTRAPAA